MSFAEQITPARPGSRGGPFFSGRLRRPAAPAGGRASCRPPCGTAAPRLPPPTSPGSARCDAGGSPPRGASGTRPRRRGGTATGKNHASHRWPWPSADLAGWYRPSRAIGDTDASGIGRGLFRIVRVVVLVQEVGEAGENPPPQLVGRRLAAEPRAHLRERLPLVAEVLKVPLTDVIRAL